MPEHELSDQNEPRKATDEESSSSTGHPSILRALARMLARAAAQQLIRRTNPIASVTGTIGGEEDGK